MAVAGYSHDELTILHEPNLLMLDEPTNFLDLRTQILLEHFLRDFKAACLIVSHDLTFLNATCTHTLGLSRGKLTSFPGKVDAFLQFQRENRERAERANAAARAITSTEVVVLPRRLVERELGHTPPIIRSMIEGYLHTIRQSNRNPGR